MQGLDTWLRYTLHDDGSIRSNTYRVGKDLAVYPQFAQDGTPILCHGMSASERFGLEVATHPYSYSEMLLTAEKLSQWFKLIPQTPRTAIHVHVDVAGESWKYIQNILRWVYALEAPIFRLSCAGACHRGERDYGGESNDHRYARPLSNPIGITWGRRLGPLILWNNLMQARTASEFVAAWGRLDLFWPGSGPLNLPHYCPHRLHMVNLASVPRQGTFEWRVFDGLYEFIPQIVQLVASVHRLADQGEPDFAPILLGSDSADRVELSWLSSLLDMDLSPLWGENWPKRCQMIHRRSHYNDAPTLYDFDHEPLRKLVVSGRRVDDGSDSFVLFDRR